MPTTAIAQTASQNGTVALVGRILLAAVFILSGFDKLSDISGTASVFASLHLPAPTTAAVVVGLLEVVGGVAVLIGFKTRVIAYALALFCVASGVIAQTNWADESQLIGFQKNLAMAGGFLVLAAFGPGALSVDARR